MWRERTKLGPLRVPELRSFELSLSASHWSLYIRLGLDFYFAKISQISFKIKINIISLCSDYEYLKIFGEI